MKKDDTPKDTASKSCPDLSKYKREPTKLELVLSYLIKKGSAAQMETIELCDSWRLSAVVHTLKKAGIPIERKDEPHKGGKHARYFLIDTERATQHLEKIQTRRLRKKPSKGESCPLIT